MSSSTKELKHIQIPLQEISLATNHFSEENKIAAGGFGTVYRGESDKHGIIAVKRLVTRENGQGNHEFLTEIEMLSSCEHENIVYFHGFISLKEMGVSTNTYFLLVLYCLKCCAEGCVSESDWPAVTVINHYQASQITAGQSGCDTQPDAPSGIWSDVYYGFSDAEALQQSGMMTSASHSAPTGSSPLWNYDVFISFRGEDTRKTFVDHLYYALEQQGIHTYKDETLPAGPFELSPVLFKAISESRISVIVFSKNYAHSSWCLDELEYILKCKDERGQLVMPIFYDVSPSEVRKQKRTYGEAFLKHESEHRNKAQSWRKALKDAGNLVGWEAMNDANNFLSFMYNACLYPGVVIVTACLMPSTEGKAKTSDDTSLLGIEPRMQDLKSVLEIGSGGVRIVGICGIWGSGKSTLATSLYEEISHEFEGCCFVKNVCAESRMHGLKALQEKILSDVLRSKVVLTSIEQGTSMMKGRLCQNSVLIVLDDVGHIDHLDKLAGSQDWFGDGSRILVTTRNKDLVIAHNVNRTHNVRMLDVNEAIKLFIRCAFAAGRPLKGYKEVSRNIVSKFGGHPSALISMGSFLQGKDISEWMSILAKLEGIGADALIKIFILGLLRQGARARIWKLIKKIMML
ncbi:TMV resistance protein N-like protein [Tanacetum coccineum]